LRVMRSFFRVTGLFRRVMGSFLRRVRAFLRVMRSFLRVTELFRRVMRSLFRRVRAFLRVMRSFLRRVRALLRGMDASPGVTGVLRAEIQAFLEISACAEPKWPQFADAISSNGATPV